MLNRLDEGFEIDFITRCKYGDANATRRTGTRVYYLRKDNCDCEIHIDWKGIRGKHSINGILPCEIMNFVVFSVIRFLLNFNRF